MKSFVILLLMGLLLVGCSNSTEKKQTSEKNKDDITVEDIEEKNLGTKDSQAEEEKVSDTKEDEGDGEDISNAEKTTNENGDDVYVFPMHKEGKIKEWMHQYSAIIEVSDFSVSDVLPKSVSGFEDEQADEGEMYAIVDVTFKNDGKHAKHVEDVSSTTNIGSGFLIRPDLEREDENNAINEGGNIPFVDGKIENVSLEPGDEQQVYIVFPIDKDAADQDQYYLIYQAYGDRIYAWDLKE